MPLFGNASNIILIVFNIDNICWFYANKLTYIAHGQFNKGSQGSEWMLVMSAVIAIIVEAFRSS